MERCDGNAELIFKLSETLTKKEDYGFTSQIRRSALSIPANIAEAYGRNHKSEKINFYYFSRGYLTETQSHLEYGSRVGYISKEDKSYLEQKLNLVYKELNKIVIALKNENE